jgi:hypothetical protein
MLRLTAKNQLRCLYEDRERVHRGRSPDFSIGQHLELLIRRVAALEASGIEARSDATPKSGAAEGESPTGEAGDAPTTPTESL